MNQNSYNTELVRQLLKAPRHVRALARALNTNSMTVSRKIRELEQDNVVDHQQEGKNKVYFLKKTLEAQEQAFIAEHFALMQTLREYPLLRSIVLKIKSNPRVKLAVLFGSYAQGLAHKKSDIDIYIETTSAELKKEIEQLSTKISLKTGTYNGNSTLIKEIQKNHVIIKGVELYYEKTKFFS